MAKEEKELKETEGATEAEAKEAAKSKKKASEVTFTQEQINIVNQLIEKAASKNTGGDDAISVYAQRDPKKVETVNVRRFDGKFVIGFKDVQNDPMKNTPKYVTYKFDPIRKKDKQPYIVLLLTNDGEEIEEREVILTDYMSSRDKYEAKVVEIKKDEKIKDHGMLGGTSMARSIDEKGNVIPRVSVKAESKKVTREFVVELPGFSEPVTFKEDFLA